MDQTVKAQGHRFKVAKKIGFISPKKQDLTKATDYN